MSNPRNRSVLAGKPYTTKTTDTDGQPKITVLLKTIDPRAVKVIDWASAVSATLATGAAIGSLLYIQEASLAQKLLITASPIATFLGLQLSLRALLTRTIPVVFTPNSTSFKSMFGIKHYDPHLGIKFVLDAAHNKVDEESKKIDLRRSQKKHWWASLLIRLFIRPFPFKPYWQDTKVLKLEYTGQPLRIATIYSDRVAERSVARLTAAQDIIAGYGNHTHGVSLTPQSDWGPQAGGVIVAQDGRAA